jgi:hypothetical protein
MEAGWTEAEREKTTTTQAPAKGEHDASGEAACKGATMGGSIQDIKPRGGSAVRYCPSGTARAASEKTMGHDAGKGDRR